MQLLLDGCTWGEIKVLSVWDKATASDFGHVILQPVTPPPTSGSGISAPTPGIISTPLAGAPGPSPGFASNPPSYQHDTRPSTTILGEWQPTMFDNCIALTPAYRMRWTLDVIPGMVDIGLEFALTKTQYMAFGWASPENTQHFMINSDVVVAGIDDKVSIIRTSTCFSKAMKWICVLLGNLLSHQNFQLLTECCCWFNFLACVKSNLLG